MSFLSLHIRGPFAEPVSQSASLHTKQFLEAMEAYQASMKDPKLSALNLRGSHSWNDVLQVAREAESAYLKAGEKGMRKFGRILTAKSSTLLPFTRLIPEEHYGSVLAGGLKLVFEVKTMDESRFAAKLISERGSFEDRREARQSYAGAPAHPSSD